MQESTDSYGLGIADVHVHFDTKSYAKGKSHQRQEFRMLALFLKLSFMAQHVCMRVTVKHSR